MRITISVDTGEGPQQVTTNLFNVITWERKFKRRAGDLAAGIGAEDLAFLAYEASKTAGLTVPLVFDDYARKIVSLELAKVAERLKDHDLNLVAIEEALALLAEQGYDSEFGARPLRRVIQMKVEDPLSDKLLSGEFTDGDNVTIKVDDDGEIALEKTSEPVAEPSL